VEIVNRGLGLEFLTGDHSIPNHSKFVRNVGII
jgi:hypothetical protein